MENGNKLNTSDTNDDDMHRLLLLLDLDATQLSVLSSLPDVAGTTRNNDSSSSSSDGGIGGAGSDSVQLVSLAELQEIGETVTNMALAHEIAVDDNFRLHPHAPPANSVEDRVKTAMHQAFWDVLQEALDQRPPNYVPVASLLTEIREIIVAMLLPWQSRIKQEIEERLDEALISQQCSSRTLDVGAYIGYILHLMQRLCAPERDSLLAQLVSDRERVAVSATLRGLMEALTLMRLDMANVHVQLVRPLLAAKGVEYERRKFEDYVQSSGDPLTVTRNWLLAGDQVGVASGQVGGAHTEVGGAHTEVGGANAEVGGASATVGVANTAGGGASLAVNTNTLFATLSAAYVRLLSVTCRVTSPPETLQLDWQRVQQLRVSCRQLVLVTGALLLTASAAPPLRPRQLPPSLKQQLLALVDDSSSSATATTTSGAGAEEPVEPGAALQAAAARAAVQCVTVARAAAESGGAAAAAEEGGGEVAAAAAELERRITELGVGADSQLFSLLERRLLAFVCAVLDATIGGATGAAVPLPRALTVCAAEVKQLSARAVKLFSHNRRVYANFYLALLQSTRQSVLPGRDS